MKKIFIYYSLSGKGDHAKEKIRNLFDIDAVILKEPKENSEELDKIKE